MNESELLEDARWDAEIAKLCQENTRLRSMLWFMPIRFVRLSKPKRNKTNRRVQTEATRRAALVAIQTQAVRDVARQYGVSERAIFKWKRQARAA